MHLEWQRSNVSVLLIRSNKHQCEYLITFFVVHLQIFNFSTKNSFTFGPFTELQLNFDRQTDSDKFLWSKYFCVHYFT